MGRSRVLWQALTRGGTKHVATHVEAARRVGEVKARPRGGWRVSGAALLVAWTAGAVAALDSGSAGDDEQEEARRARHQLQQASAAVTRSARGARPMTGTWHGLTVLSALASVVASVHHAEAGRAPKRLAAWAYAFAHAFATATVLS